MLKRRSAPPPEQRTEQIHLRCTPSDVERLQRVARLAGLKQSEVMRQALALFEARLLARHDRSRTAKKRSAKR